MNSRDENIARLNNFDADVTNPYFLHYRSLFSDLRKASFFAYGRMLDVGCGNKPYAKMFADKIAEHVGCDVVQSSERCVDVICPATELLFADCTFNTVLATQVIEHVADHRSMLLEVFRVLEKKGFLILSGPMYWPLHEEPYDFFRFTKYGLEFLLKSVGFIEIEILNNGGRWALCGQVLIHTIMGTRLQRDFIVRAINWLFAYLDDKRTISDNPMNYVVIARKP